MSEILKTLVAGALCLASFTSAASATTVVNCSTGSGLTCLVAPGSPFYALSPGNSGNDKEVSVEAALAAALNLTSIDLTLLGKSDDGYGSGAIRDNKSGTFTTPSKVSYFTVKAGTGYLIFDGMNTTSSDWNTMGLVNGGEKQPGLSHISYWSAPLSPVPLPAAGWLLIAGLGGIAAMKRRTKA